MADIAMCQDDLCPSAKTCRRNEASGTVPNSYYQNYSTFVHLHSTGKCEDYKPISTVQEPSDG